ncbi:chorismate mutase [Methylococcaceae bacterium HT4]|nr:prephenate dehydratase [Methyloprofundus sp.]TXK96322.1 chorismate mutase [Methylococcaceae bacterium CS4]TXK97590.1 chorismate mutase [Methylococcaceae bacterium CS5]TXL05235.1 chorismate mutase [Methylococcaceae bacterium CS1]TXL05616.1 chorismate mutase [Methylococcaceae bacterium CS3]TXL10147.1 chorismate mutase [Methylococcaceae bacterium CS2]TXL14515.1 chorismate mutase [Methylococcaceae bacterium HT4]TXL19833.1 chorismate mutase [Methylococcaceae bacterium HT5]
MTNVIPLADLRNQIDAIDQQVLQLINQRASLAEEVAKTKIASGEDSCFYRPDREALVLRRIKELNPGPLSNDTAARFFRELMSACLALERPLQVAFLGPEGTFTQQAAYKHFGHAVCTEAVTTIEDIFQEVESGRCQFGVVPIENSTEGVVTPTLDRFVASPVQICGEVAIRIQHNLMANVTSLNEITEVVSHRQSLAQCRKWLDKYLPGVLCTEVNSNAEAARIASSKPGVAAIAGEVAAEIYNVSILESGIEDQPDNTTRFVIIGRLTSVSTNEDKTSLLISTKNHAGALYSIIEPFAKYGISMTKIESRPSRQGLWDYLFFIDIDGHQTDKDIVTALEELKSRVTMIKVLGSYPKAIL